MKKLSLVVGYMLITILLLVGCKKPTYEISIKTDRNSYSLTSSAIQGIKMSPELKTNDKSTEIEYYWTITDGAFIGTKDKEVINTGGSMTWSAIADNSSSVPSIATVTLMVREKGTNKILTKTSLTIDGKDSTYTVKK